jgi:hypothetical protein
MSVAFDDQGEIVPIRGVTRNSAPRFRFVFLALFEQCRKLATFDFAERRRQAAKCQ